MIDFTQPTLEVAGVVILAGIVIVFAALIVLTLFIQCLGAVISRISGGKGPKKPAGGSKSASASAPAAPKASNIVRFENGIDDETVAVISAAVAAMMSDDGKSYVVKSIRRVKPSRSARSAWAFAGIADNVRQF